MKEELQAAWHAETASLFLRAGKPFAKFREKKLMFPMETDGTAEKILCKNKKNKNGMEDEMEKGIQILVVEDDPDINGLILRILRKQGYQVTQAFSGTEAGLWLGQKEYDLMILDLMLPGLDGMAVLEKVRKEWQLEIPVLILSAKAGLEDKVGLLTAGADDYMTKPFEPAELTARVGALLRRSAGRTEKQGRKTAGETEEKAGKENSSLEFSYKNIRLLPESRAVLVKGQEVELTRYEYEILYLLMQFPEKVFSRESLYEQVWQGGYYGEDNTVNVHVSNLRKKLAAADPGEEYIKTVWGIGFKMA